MLHAVDFYWILNWIRYPRWNGCRMAVRSPPDGITILHLAVAQQIAAPYEVPMELW